MSVPEGSERSRGIILIEKADVIPIKRQQSIINYLLDAEVAAINDLAAMLGVSPMTIRRDVQKLELAGRVVSVSGGVAISTEISREPSHQAKRDMQRGEKEAIARLAETLVGDSGTIYLDAGTTTLALARRLAEKRRRDTGLMVVTNDLVITAYLVDNSLFRVYHTGGLVARENRSSVGDGAARTLQALNIDIAFISAPSWDSGWLTTPDADKTPVKKAAAASSRRRILLTDSRKYGKIGTFKAVPMSAFKTVVTDDGLALGAREALEKQGVEVLVARVGGQAQRRKSR